MAKTYEECLEQQDLILLRRRFDSKAENAKAPEEITAEPVSAGSDIWSEAIRAVSEGNKEEMQRIRAQIMHSGLTSEEKHWWDCILNIAMHAPPEVLGKLARGTREMPPQLSTECVSVAARLLAAQAEDGERRRRREAERQEKEKLRKLREEAERLEQEKCRAEQNLQRHVRPQEDRK